MWRRLARFGFCIRSYFGAPPTWKKVQFSNIKFSDVSVRLAVSIESPLGSRGRHYSSAGGCFHVSIVLMKSAAGSSKSAQRSLSLSFALVFFHRSLGVPLGSVKCSDLTSAYLFLHPTSRSIGSQPKSRKLPIQFLDERPLQMSRLSRMLFRITGGRLRKKTRRVSPPLSSVAAAW